MMYKKGIVIIQEDSLPEHTTDPNHVLGSLEHKTITVSMNGPNGTRIPGAIIHGMVIPPPPITANLHHNFNLIDSGGKFYQMKISKNARSVQCVLNVQEQPQIPTTLLHS